MTPRPVLPLMPVRPKENLDQKEKVSNKTTEDNLKKFLYQWINKIYKFNQNKYNYH